MFKTEGNKQARVLTFDGVRAEESTRRSNYGRIGKGVKHDTVINARPILNWSTVEIFLYLWRHNLHINPAYRQGMTRVGCLICPFGNEWNEVIAHKEYKEPLMPFLTRVENYAKKGGIKDVENYVSEGGWKRRGSGDLVDRDCFIDFKSASPTFKAKITRPRIPIYSYLQTLGDYSLTTKDKITKGDIKIKDKIYAIQIKETENNIYEFEIDNIYDLQLVGELKKVLLKSTYCIHCETCEVECPTGALKVYPKVIIDKTKCVHCHKCLDFHEKGCIAANSLYLTKGNKMNKTNIDRYKNFGLKEEWVESYLMDKDDFWTGNHGLNQNYQVPALKAWLRDAEIIDAKNNITKLGNLLADNREDYPDLVWEVIWTNLSYNSFVINWFDNNIPAGAEYSSKEMEAMILDQYDGYKEKTVHNAVYQLQRTLKESPVGTSMNQMEAIDKSTFRRGEYSELSPEALAYSIYKYADTKGILSLRVADFYSPENNFGPAKEFGISKATLENILRSLNSNSNRVLIAELNMGLDSISLREDLNAFNCLKNLLR